MTVESGNPISWSWFDGAERKPSNPVSTIAVIVFSPLGPTTVTVVMGRDVLSSQALAIASDAVQTVEPYLDQVKRPVRILVLGKLESVLRGSGKISLPGINLDSQELTIFPFIGRGHPSIQALAGGSNFSNRLATHISVAHTVFSHIHGAAQVVPAGRFGPRSIVPKVTQNKRGRS
jgi:hypothetical protein